MLTNGNSVSKIGTFEDEVGLSQVMIAIDPTKANSVELTDKIVNDIIADVKSSQPVQDGKSVLYPGERTLQAIQDNMEHGIPVIDEIWDSVLAM